ncbi:hypothetical protein [Rubrivirga sp.]|uniref:hypothetical protein n=1 Tax=Rubrivirga sp. TaxID=1885344 RepID=UPI003C70D041
MTRLPGLDGAVFHSTSLTSRTRDGLSGRSVSVSGVIGEPGTYIFDESRFDSPSTIYFDEAGDPGGVWSAVSGTLVVTRNDDDTLEGSVDAVLERRDYSTGVSGGRTVLDADFAAIPFPFSGR